MSTQFDRIFEGLSTNSLTLEDACRVLYSESQAGPDSMRVCCERIEIELSHGRITSDAAQLLLDPLGERNQEEHHAAAAKKMWVDVPLQPLGAQGPPAHTPKVARGQNIHPSRTSPGRPAGPPWNLPPPPAGGQTPPPQGQAPQIIGPSGK